MEVPVMQTNSTYQFPHPRHRIQIRTIGGQKIEDEAVGVLQQTANHKDTVNCGWDAE